MAIEKRGVIDGDTPPDQYPDPFKAPQSALPRTIKEATDRLTDHPATRVADAVKDQSTQR